MKNIHKKFTLSYFNHFFKILLFFSITSITFANENKIGSVTEINGTIVAINNELELILDLSNIQRGIFKVNNLII